MHEYRQKIHCHACEYDVADNKHFGFYDFIMFLHNVPSIHYPYEALMSDALNPWV